MFIDAEDDRDAQGTVEPDAVKAETALAPPLAPLLAPPRMRPPLLAVHPSAPPERCTRYCRQ